MAMKLGNPGSIAIIDPRKKRGEEGQYVQHKGALHELYALAEQARREGKEIRWYYRDLQTEGEEGGVERIASHFIITEVPPRHVQPFHTHYELHEITLVLKGQVVSVNSDTLSEDDLKATIADGRIWQLGEPIGRFQTLTEKPGTRHTVANPSSTEWAHIITVQTARKPIEEFSIDWVADKK